MKLIPAIYLINNDFSGNEHIHIVSTHIQAVSFSYIERKRKRRWRVKLQITNFEFTLYDELEQKPMEFNSIEEAKQYIEELIKEKDQ
jgi:hypothetical protein